MSTSSVLSRTNSNKFGILANLPQETRLYILDFLMHADPKALVAYQRVHKNAYEDIALMFKQICAFTTAKRHPYFKGIEQIARRSLLPAPVSTDSLPLTLQTKHDAYTKLRSDLKAAVANSQRALDIVASFPEGLRAHVQEFLNHFAEDIFKTEDGPTQSYRAFRNSFDPFGGTANTLRNLFQASINREQDAALWQELIAAQNPQEVDLVIRKAFELVLCRSPQFMLMEYMIETCRYSPNDSRTLYSLLGPIPRTTLNITQMSYLDSSIALGEYRKAWQYILFIEKMDSSLILSTINTILSIQEGTTEESLVFRKLVLSRTKIFLDQYIDRLCELVERNATPPYDMDQTKEQIKAELRALPAKIQATLEELDEA